ncbi:MAG TPA: hypothetical protein VD731_01550 [Nitrosopumilaceae archaeon]|nr:hypothetical protein [Nitrosopumilaceae archaeon]
MPLTNNVIIELNNITMMTDNKNSLNPKNEEFIKNIFKKILDDGETYNVEEIESWFQNEGTWKNRNVITRITNMSHYIQEKHKQIDKLRIISDKNSCKCD